MPYFSTRFPHNPNRLGIRATRFTNNSLVECLLHIVSDVLPLAWRNSPVGKFHWLVISNINLMFNSRTHPNVIFVCTDYTFMLVNNVSKLTSPFVILLCLPHRSPLVFLRNVAPLSLHYEHYYYPLYPRKFVVPRLCQIYFTVDGRVFHYCCISKPCFLSHY